jgi:hypothetical protein
MRHVSMTQRVTRSGRKTKNLSLEQCVMESQSDTGRKTKEHAGACPIDEPLNFTNW